MRRLLVCLGLLALPGCGLMSPRASPAAHAPAGSALATAQARHEYPSPPPRPATAPGAGSPTAAITAFATAYINWNAQTVTGDLETLAAGSIGQARAAMALAAAQTGGDYELRRGGIANRGEVEAVAGLRGAAHEGGGASGRYVVITREQTLASATNAYQGLAPAWHVTLATVTRESTGRWVVSSWQPES